jgi:hypothetical protein
VPALHIMTRVARWYIFKPKNPIWANFGGSWNRTIGIFYGSIIRPVGILNCALL